MDEERGRKKRGRRVSFQPVQVLKILERGAAKKEDIAGELGCSGMTVYRLIVRLIQDGNDIGFNGDGYFLLVKDELHKDDIRVGQDWTARLYSMLIRMVKRTEVHIPIAKQIRARVINELSAPERKQFKQQLLLMVNVVNAAEIDEELDR